MFSTGVLLLVAACDGTVDITIETAPDALSFEVRDTDIEIPDELRDGVEIARVSCGDSLPCPSMLGDQSFACSNGLCDPERTVIVVPLGDVIDFEQLSSELREVAGHIEAIQIDFVRYNVTQNDLNVPLEPLEIAWGPADATDLTSPGVLPFGRIEQWSLGVNNVDLHEEGIGALSDYLVHTSRQIRLFGRTAFDLAPGQPLPLGAIATDMQLAITVTGRLL